MLSELNQICQHKFSSSAQNVLINTPQSQLVKKPSKAENQSAKRKIVRKVKKTIQQALNDTVLTSVMVNRVSWAAYDRMRKTEALTSTPSRKRTHSGNEENELPMSKRLHGCYTDSLPIDEDSLLCEASAWSTNEDVNWSALARKYGLLQTNGGQILKEFLQKKNVAAAFTNQRPNRAARRERKKLPEGIPFPMKKPPSQHRKELSNMTETGELLLGKEVVESTQSTYTLNRADNTIVETTKTVHARQIRLLEIRKKLLAKHESLGLVRENSDEYIDSLTDAEVKERLGALSGKTSLHESSSDLRQRLKKISQQRFLKIWHATPQWQGTATYWLQFLSFMTQHFTIPVRSYSKSLEQKLMYKV